MLIDFVEKIRMLFHGIRLFVLGDCHEEMWLVWFKQYMLVYVSTVLIQSVKIQWDFIEIQRGVPCSDTAKWYAHWRWCDLRQELKKKFEP